MNTTSEKGKIKNNAKVGVFDSWTKYILKTTYAGENTRVRHLLI